MSSSLFFITTTTTPPTPVYAEWADWSECTKTCGTGLQMRIRYCTRYCFDQSKHEIVEERTCNPGSCTFWDQWTGWGSCSATCGDGKIGTEIGTKLNLEVAKK